MICAYFFFWRAEMSQRDIDSRPPPPEPVDDAKAKEQIDTATKWSLPGLFDRMTDATLHPDE